MNDDLISRSALLSGYDVRKVTEYDESGCGVDYKAVPVEAIEKAPAVDAEPVRHGYWVNKTEPQYAALEMRFDCSVCNHIFYSGSVRTFRYCPWCGAMNAEVE